jgi:hypothetical protein
MLQDQLSSYAATLFQPMRSAVEPSRSKLPQNYLGTEEQARSDPTKESRLDWISRNLRESYNFVGHQSPCRRDSGEGGRAMPQISALELQELPLRVHAFLADVPLHDVWAIDLPRWRAGITLDEFVRAAGTRSYRPAPVVRLLLRLRFFIGRLFGWDREPRANSWEGFATRLTAIDQSRSLVPPGTPDGLFRVVYRFENEQLLEVINRTAHAAALSTLVETGNVYRFYLGVYVRSVGPFTPIYMGLIGPFRKLIVYPSLLRSVREVWNQVFQHSAT